jgi:predicted metal-dependent peptidase
MSDDSNDKKKSRIRATVTKDLMDKEFVSVDEKSRCLATAIYSCTRTSPFIGSVLQCLNISYAHTLQTAGIMFNNDAKRWDMYINPYFFCKKLDDEQRKAVLMHELSHITHKHPLRVPFMKISAHKRMLMNIAADMAINQFIKGLPNGCPQCPPKHTEQPCKNEMCPGRCIDVNDYYDTDPVSKTNKPWEKNKPFEFYYEKLIRRFQDPEDNDGKPGPGGNAGGGADTDDLPQTLDEHLWDGSAEEKDMLEATEDLVKRAMVKARLSYDDLPGHVKELLDDIKARRAELNYRALILSAMKKHASGHDRKNTWTRKSKRFGYKAPGTKVGELPKLHNYIDTSGSISIEEANEFLEIVDQFLKVGARKCRLNMFHTVNYYSEEYKLGQRIKREDIQNGGTDLKQSLQDIYKRKPDLAVFLTDGCYENVEVESWMKPGEQFPQCLFIISKEGNEEHPLARLGYTVKVPNSGGKR